MADLQFSIAKGTLKGFGKTWRATSGIPGKVEPLEARTYVVKARSLMTGTEKLEGVGFNRKYAAAPYRDRKGFGWFCWLGVGQLGIHPDGNVPGTKGCIGIRNGDTRGLFEELRKRNSRALTVRVTD